MVKDHRTEHTVSDTSTVLDGDLDEFVMSYLRSTVGDTDPKEIEES